MSRDRNSVYFFFASIFFRICIEWYSFGMGKRYEQYCPMAHALDLVGDRWALLVVRELMHGPKRYTDLVDRLHGIGTNILATRLRDLEAHGVVARRTLPPPAASKVYELTDYGRELRPALRELALWGAPLPRPAHGGDGGALRGLAGQRDGHRHRPPCPDRSLRVPRRQRDRLARRQGSPQRPDRRPRCRGRRATRTASTPCSSTGASTWSRSTATGRSWNAFSRWLPHQSRRRSRHRRQRRVEDQIWLFDSNGRLQW